MSFTYNNGVPDANNNPSVDQPDMKTNAQSIESLIAIDHISFNTANGGTHKQVSFDDKNVPAAQTDPQSVLFTNNIAAPGTYNTTSANTVSELFYSNQFSDGGDLALPVSMIKAFGCFDNTGASKNAWNLVLKSVGGHPSTGTYVFNMPANIITGSEYLIFGSAQLSGSSLALIFSYSIASNVEFTVSWNLAVAGSKQDPQTRFNLLVMQL